MTQLNRRGFLTAASVTGLGMLLATPTVSAVERALRTNASRIANPDGTTLATVATPVTEGLSYTRLGSGPGWPLQIREELLAGKAGRDDRRTALTSFVQFTDMHITDTQSPARFEYLHPFIGSAYRPHETLWPSATAALVNRVNSLRGGPLTGRAFDFVMTTGDNTDNHEHIELSWFLDILNGGMITPNSGDPNRYEGVQDSGHPLYWNPAIQLEDDYTTKGFPQIPDLLDAAITRFESPGLRMPWYCTFGNHDDSVVGTLPEGLPGIEHWYTSDSKVIGKDERTSRELAKRMEKPGANIPLSQLFGGDSGAIRKITPDERRKPFTTGEFARAHLDQANIGSGPEGHGFTGNNAEGLDVYYTFRVAEGITGVSLDTTTMAGFADGSIGLGQFNWLEQTLRRGSSVYYDGFGNKQTHQVTDELFILFSHHTSATMGNVLPDMRHPLELRLAGDALVNLLTRFPNVLAWVNGHTHRNEIIPHPDESPERGFWEINTASHIDFPQHARIIELADNMDGTLSLFTTLLEADAPYSVDYGETTVRALGSIYRELSYNDIHAKHERLGELTDRNTELILANPLSQ